MSLLTSLRTRTGFIEPNPELALLPEMVRYFLTGAIKERAKILAQPANESFENYVQIVSLEYTQRMEKALSEEIASFKESNPQMTFPAFLEGKLKEVFFREQLQLRDFASPEDFEKLLGKVRSHFGVKGLIQGRPLPPQEARAIASVLLRSVQKVALQIISNDYPATAKKIIVPENIQKTIKELLASLDANAARLLPNPELKSLPRAEAQLNVAIARSELRVALPVRSIPTAPLADAEVKDHYVGRPDEDAHRLARQVRHADGTILVTGYRGVGKSSFVNRVIYHATSNQRVAPADGWLLVPITINLAKVAGVQNILRITLRSVRNALINPTSADPQPIPGFATEAALPLDATREIEPLQEAYARATYKVTMTRANATETKLAADGSLGFDVGKVLAPFSGFQFPSFGFKGSKSRTRTLNRSLSLLDYDETAAEDDLMLLIRNLAIPRPLYGDSGQSVGIKLVFIFDELDKMDTDTGLKPMIEGLKNLFLQRHAVFILVTSKMFYYHLLAERAKEDTMLSSYFSAIVPVPLLTFEQARKIVDDWIDWPEGVSAPVDIEKNLLDQLTRLLLYRSYGNPRDIIRELRQMQEWADTTERPYLSDRLTKSQSLQIFAGIQRCIEKVSRPDSDKISSNPIDGGALTLVSERLGGDESRLEQIRRGLYILTEALINQETLSVKLMDLEQLRKDNFSLLRDSDVEQLAIQLGNSLSLLHQTLPKEVFAPLNLTEPPELFVMSSEILKTTTEFYRLTGRQGAGTDVEVKPTAEPQKEVKELVSQAEDLSRRPGWGERLSAIGIIKQIGPVNVSPALERFLLDLSKDKNEPVPQRREAAKQLTQEMLFRDPNLDLTAFVIQEPDDEMLSLFLPLLGKASDDTSKKRAAAAVLALFKASRPLTGGGGPARLSGKTAELALTVLPAVANLAGDDALDVLLDWLCSSTQPADVQDSALATLNLLSEKLGADQGEKILSSEKFFEYFVNASRPIQPGSKDALVSMLVNPYQGGVQNLELRAKYESHLRKLFAEKPLYYIEKLLRANSTTDVNYLLTPLWQAAFDRTSPELAQFVMRLLATEDAHGVAERLEQSLWQTPEFEVRMLPYLKTHEQSVAADYPDEARKMLEVRMVELAVVPKKVGEAAPQSEPAEVITPDGEYSTVNSPRDFFERCARGCAYSLIAGSFIVPTLLIEVFLFRGDLLQGASLSRAFGSRLILFAADLAVVSGFVRSLLRDPDYWQRLSESGYPSSSWLYSKTFQTVFSYTLPLAGVALLYLHHKYLGPLTVLMQLILFVINLPATIVSSLILTRSTRSLRPVGSLQEKSILQIK